MASKTSRKIPASPSRVFAAFEDAVRLAIWWGPDGFTNTFHSFEFKPGGKWSLVMHGPDGKNYPNENVFVEIEPARRIVYRHVSQPRYQLTVTLESTPDGGTLVGWDQVFENPDFERNMGEFLATANEQVLSRLSAEVLRE